MERMTAEELAVLKAVAMELRGLEWKVQIGSINGANRILTSEGDVVVSVTCGPSDDEARFIAAANPSTILRLVEQAGRVTELENALRDIGDLCFGMSDVHRIAQSALRAEPASQLDAPAPPEVAVKLDEQMARFAIDGAISYGRMGINPPPTTEHWLNEYWQIGRQLAKLGETCAWDNVTPTAPVEQSAPPVPPMDQSSCIPPSRAEPANQHDADAKDAARYRWLCNNNFDRERSTQIHTWVHEWHPHSVTNEPTEWKQRVRGGALDRVIDEMMNEDEL